jgi:hypothetical protein
LTFNVEADNSADEIATAIIHLHVPKSFDVVLLRRSATSASVATI